VLFRSRHLALSERAGQFKQTVGQRGFTVVDVRYDAEIPDELGIHVSFRICVTTLSATKRSRPSSPFKLSSVP
jgi:hypothetical protein